MSTNINQLPNMNQQSNMEDDDDAIQEVLAEIHNEQNPQKKQLYTDYATTYIGRAEEIARKFPEKIRHIKERNTQKIAKLGKANGKKIMDIFL